jgi:molybdate transport system ATP-binding protein
VAHGPAAEVLSRADLPVARRDDAGALLACRVSAHDPTRGLTTLDAGGTALLVPLLDIAVGRRCRVRIPAREVILAGRAPEAISLHNVVPGTVRRIAQDTMHRSVLVEVALPHGALLSRVTSDAVQRLALAPGTPVLALIKSTSIEVLSIE